MNYSPVLLCLYCDRCLLAPLRLIHVLWMTLDVLVKSFDMVAVRELYEDEP